MSNTSNPSEADSSATAIDSSRRQDPGDEGARAPAHIASHPSRLRVLLAFAAIYTIWGSTYLAIKVSVETIPPFLMAGGRFLIAGGLLYVLARLRGAERPTREHWKNAALVGSLLFLAGNGALSWAELHVPSGLAALLLSIIPLWMVMLHHFELRRGLGPQLILGLVLGLGGIGLLVGPRELLGGGRVSPVGAGVLVVGSLGWAIGSLYSRNASMPKSSLLAASMEMLTGGVGLLLFGFAAGEGRALSYPGISAHSLWAVAYLIVFGSLIGFSSYNWLLGVSTPSRVATYAYVNPIIAVFVGWALGGESLTARILVATVVIVSAVALIITHQARSVAGKDTEDLPPSGECPETVV
jgi:drug/metabolite transporter (DMT)-like permease